MSITLYLSTGEARTFVPFSGITMHAFDLVGRSLSRSLDDDVIPADPTGWTSFAGDGDNQQSLGE